ncbi:Asp23/Gls24 family envelope stress response protein [Streptomyces dubilierae]|uniref:Nucleopolyhedrovirus P10 family protein n=1 Tax=Streptomyces dubilierae TaxID=3075533 RepID=A0ABU2PDB3_9ACTN|nr:nucleopolyhedrovirus P10 family protein [Streptomyces sp. DSM 41921]MDT0389812.1 nucleopolyhedrovirus P10 family protein [Streptomyces sp. DSM 41921]
MTADRWTRAVRHQLGLGRLLPLGEARDGAWIAERAAEAVLGRAARGTPGVRLDALRIALADPADTPEPAVPAPPSALPPGPLRVTAEFTATASQPLPATASLLRAALAGAAARQVGLTVTEIDLKVTGLLEEDPDGEPGAALPEPPRAERVEGGDEGRVAAAALEVAGVLGLTGTLGHPVHIEERPAEAALTHRHVRLEVAVAADHRAGDVARAVRSAVAEALPDHPTVAVVVSAVG